MRSIDGYQKWTHIRTHISGERGHLESRVGETGEKAENYRKPFNGRP
jgi:hypothetical protein